MSNVFTFLVLFLAIGQQLAAQIPPPKIPVPDKPIQLIPTPKCALNDRLCQLGLPGEGTTIVVKKTVDDKPEALSATTPVSIEIEVVANTIIEKINKLYAMRTYTGSILESATVTQFLNGIVDVYVLINADGRITSAAVKNYPKNPAKKKYAVEAIDMLIKNAPYSVKLSRQNLALTLTFFFDDEGTFKVQRWSREIK